MNLANKLTIFRMILVPIIMVVPIIDNLAGIPGEDISFSSFSNFSRIRKNSILDTYNSTCKRIYSFWI